MTILEISLFEKNIAIISLVVAGLSILISLRSNYFSKKALKLSQLDYSNKQPKFDLYYENGYRFLINSGSQTVRILVFHISIQNKSEFRNTLKASLEIEYLRENDSFARVQSEHNPELKKAISNKDITFFPKDIEIEAKTTSTKWLIFKQPDFLDKNHRIENYNIRLIDLDGNKSSVESSLIKDVEYEN